MKKTVHIGTLEKRYSLLPPGSLQKALDNWSKEEKKLRRKLREFQKAEDQLQDELVAAEKNLQAIMTAIQNCHTNG
jgi:predicted  nucleic acid-binding Zn-ribbon protein